MQIDIVPRYFEVFGGAAEVHTLEGIPLVGLRPTRLSRSSRILKRAFDLTAATLGLLFLAPLFAGVALCITLESRGPIFFRQVRRGASGTTFRIYKFRTMVAEAEEKKADVAHLNMHRERDPRMTKIPNDPRITRIGRFLRRSSIDELPQLINVIKGEMSIVGPRPLILEEDAFVLEWARKRLDIKPGITGLWQVLGRSDIPFDEMTKLDYVYVTNWSLREDIRLILLTVPALLRSGARSDQASGSPAMLAPVLDSSAWRAMRSSRTRCSRRTPGMRLGRSRGSTISSRDLGGAEACTSSRRTGRPPSSSTSRWTGASTPPLSAPRCNGVWPSTWPGLPASRR